MLKQLTPCLWFDGKAKEAVDFYCAIFPNFKVVPSVLGELMSNPEKAPKAMYAFMQMEKKFDIAKLVEAA